MCLSTTLWMRIVQLKEELQPPSLPFCLFTPWCLDGSQIRSVRCGEFCRNLIQTIQLIVTHIIDLAATTGTYFQNISPNIAGSHADGMSRGNSVQRRAMGRTVGVRFSTGARVFLISAVFRPAQGPAKSSIHWVMVAFTPEGKAAGAWSWSLHLLMEGLYLHTPYVIMAWCLSN
jgi:hypothetical protein